MKSVLCYGDSNTWGANPATGERYPRHERWPGVMALELGDEYDVIAEGLCGRTTVLPDPLEPALNGRTYLVPCLNSHAPLDLVIILLGTNDLKTRFSLPAVDIAGGAGVLVDIVKRSGTGPGGRPPAVLLVAPPPILDVPVDPESFADGQARSREFGRLYRRVAQLLGCHFLDAGEIIRSSATDGIHLDAGEHRKLGQACAERARAILAGC